MNDDFVAYLPVNLSVKKIENRSTFGEVMDNIVVPFLTHSVECGPMPNVMAALPNTGGALCSTP